MKTIKLYNGVEIPQIGYGASAANAAIALGII